MKSWETPSPNCPACCPLKTSYSKPAQFSNGQVPINLSKSKKPTNLEPRRFSGRDWRLKFQEFHLPPKVFDHNSKHNWSGGPGNAVKPEMAFEFGSFGETAHSSIALLKNHWTVSCGEVGAAVKYLRHLWLTTNGNYSEKLMVVNRMICFYLILLGIHIAETGFWVDQQLLDGLYLVLLKPKRNLDMMMGIGAVVFFIFLLYLIGGPATSASETVCSIQRD